MEKVRLNKFIAATGLCSRRKADELIASGKVKVNGKVTTDFSTAIGKTDKVLVENKPIATKYNYTYIK